MLGEWMNPYSFVSNGWAEKAGTVTTMSKYPNLPIHKRQAKLNGEV